MTSPDLHNLAVLRHVCDTYLINRVSKEQLMLLVNGAREMCTEPEWTYFLAGEKLTMYFGEIPTSKISKVAILNAYDLSVARKQERIFYAVRDPALVSELIRRERMAEKRDYIRPVIERKQDKFTFTDKVIDYELVKKYMDLSEKSGWGKPEWLMSRWSPDALHSGISSGGIVPPKKQP